MVKISNDAFCNSIYAALRADETLQKFLEKNFWIGQRFAQHSRVFLGLTFVGWLYDLPARFGQMGLNSREWK